MKIDKESGLVQGVRFVSSPNHDARPEGSSPEVIVIHSISLPPGQYGGTDIEKFFCNCLNSDSNPFYQDIKDLQVSAHFLILRTGEIVQFVSLHRRAWHAGQSYCEGRTRVNDFSIGIEMEGADDAPFEDRQYRSLAQLTKMIQAAYPDITCNRIYGHADIAPGRKTDPGSGFDWQYYLKLCA